MNIRTVTPIMTTIIAKVRFVIQLQINSERHIAPQMYHIYIGYYLFTAIRDVFQIFLKSLCIYFLIERTDSSSDSSLFVKGYF